MACFDVMHHTSGSTRLEYSIQENADRYLKVSVTQQGRGMLQC